jgi:NTE family protein
MAGPPRSAAVLSRRSALVGTALAGAAMLAGCALDPDTDHTGPDAPTATPLLRPARVAWVFSSGGPRGFVHVGVVKALDELGLQPDLIVGASVGALVAVLRAAGLRGPALQTLALDLQPARLARLSITGSERLSGAALADLVHEELQALGQRPLLQTLPVMAVCVSTRLSDRVPIAFNRGDAGLAVQAACAIEGQFSPVRIRGQRHADADLTLPMPVRLARALGAQRVLAVDASAHETRAPPGTERWREGDLRKRALTQPDAAAADLLLHPDIGYYASISREYRERCIAAGYRSTMAEAVRLRGLHGVG